VDPLDHSNLPADQTANLREMDDASKALPPGEADNDAPLTPEEMEQLYDQFEMEDDANYKFDRILDYEFKDGVLILKAQYMTMILENMIWLFLSRSLNAMCLLNWHTLFGTRSLKINEVVNTTFGPRAPCKLMHGVYDDFTGHTMLIPPTGFIELDEPR
jgi:hypothetical protein